MKKRKFAVMMLVCITLAGCGDSSDGVTSTAEQETEQIPTPTPIPTPAQSFVYGQITPWLADSRRSEDIECNIAENHTTDLREAGWKQI